MGLMSPRVQQPDELLCRTLPQENVGGQQFWGMLGERLHGVNLAVHVGILAHEVHHAQGCDHMVVGHSHPRLGTGAAGVSVKTRRWRSAHSR